jgi:4-carboxymuconolactone decarboxylase
MTNPEPPFVPVLPREQWNDAARDVFAFWEGPEAREKGSRSNTMMTLAQHPALAMAVLELGKYMLVGSTLSPRHKEMIVLRVAARFSVDYEWVHHVHSARGIGMTDEEFAALRSGGRSTVWNPADQALVDGVDQLCSTGRIDRNTLTRLSATMDRMALIDLIYSVGFFAMNVWAVGTMGVQVEPDFAEFSKPADEMTAKLT